MKIEPQKTGNILFRTKIQVDNYIHYTTYCENKLVETTLRAIRKNKFWNHISLHSNIVRIKP